MLKMSPYLVLKGNALTALRFYQSVLGGTLTVTMQSEFNPDPAVAELLMHGQLDTATFTLMASDLPLDMAGLGSGNTQICIWGDDRETARAWFTGLAEGGTVTTEFAPQMWGDNYGDLVDQFGVVWAVNASGPNPA